MNNPVKAIASATCTSCLTGSNALSDIKVQILKLDHKIRNVLSMLMIYASVFMFTLVVIIYVLYLLYGIFQQWRIMSAAVNPPLQLPSDTLSLTGIADDEVYASELALQREDKVVPMGMRINNAMDQLEATYGAYNDQITKYSREVLKKKTPDDVFDKRVLDASNDDFDYSPLPRI